MKDDMKVQEFSLKRIAENLDRIPKDGRLPGDAPTLSKEEKRKLMEMVGRYNEYGKSLQVEEAIVNTAKALEEISKMAETYACNEAADWFQTETIKRDMQEIKKNSAEFQKIARECYSNVQRMTALYETIGFGLGRYFEIKDIQEMFNPTALPSSDVNPGSTSQQPQVMETYEEEEEQEEEQ